MPLLRHEIGDVLRDVRQLQGRTLRERRMLMVMALAIAVVLVWLLIVRPAWGWRAEAAEARAVAKLKHPNIVEVYIGYLRRKTEAAGEARLIHTVRGVGYVLRETAP